MSHFADRLTEAVRQKGNALCVGLDPRWEQLPAELHARHGGTLRGAATAVEEFCARVLDVVAPLVAVIKPQCAFFELYGPAGLRALRHTLAKARRLGLVTILDGKRNDIASTATAYADAAFAGVTLAGRSRPVWDADALTVNPYLGRDAIEPFLASARRAERGLFVLARTSNAGAGLFQDLVCDDKPLFLHVAEAVRAWTREHRGQCGYGDVGAVVGATHPDELAAVRRAVPEAIFLVPGYGAQGGSATDVAAAFHNTGLGAIVNSSRGLTAGFPPSETEWEARVEAATRAAIADLRQATPMQALGKKLEVKS
ncbi:MAG: orotidine-5'-phosphate decarboxylase [Gemmataceae bacterium]